MKFVDSIDITVTAGKGGDGVAAFRRELYVPKGGPAGGDGGKGGDIIFVASSDVNTLLELKYQKLIKADDGGNGQHKNMHGHKADNKIVKVPVGTIVIDKKTNQIICDLNKLDQKFIIAKGGKGGRGNSRFANSRNKAPTIFECGDLGETFEIRCELKLLADVGFVGLPNAGKSTLLSVLTKAKPQIANYEFTTITPQLGVAIDKNNHSFVIADLPGLIKGASSGKGLGHIFLRHIERCRIIAYVIDASGNYAENMDLYKDYLILQNELKAHNSNLLERKQLLVLNKIDVNTSQENIKKLKTKLSNDIEVIEVSGLYKRNLEQLKLKITDLLSHIVFTPVWEEQINKAKNEHKIYKFDQFKDENNFQVLNLGNGRWEIKGKAVFNIYHKFPPTTPDNLLVFNDQLKKLGVFDELRKKNAKHKDTIKIFDLEMEWKD